MARNEIGPLNVRVSADTREFVSGMANVQRRMEQTTAVIQKSRQAFNGLGSAMRMPGLGRGAALGGALSGVAGALGLGALGGGVVGLASTGAFMLVDGLIRRNERLKEIAVERLETERKIHETMLEQMRTTAQSVVDAQKIIDESLGRPTQADVSERLGRISILETELARRLSAVRSLVTSEGQTLYQYKTRREMEYVQEARDALLAEQQRQRDAMNPIQPNGLGNRLTNVLSRNVDRGSIGDIFTSLAVAGREARDAAAERAQEERLTANAIRDAVADWKRENQRSSDMLATTVGRISSQITQLTFRSD